MARRGGKIEWKQIRRRMEDVRPVLERTGSLQRKRTVGETVVFAIRWREEPDTDRVVQRSIQLGSDPTIIQKARELLASWQQKHDPRRSLDRKTRFMVDAVGEFSKYFTGNERRRYRKHHLAAVADARGFMAAVNEWPRQFLDRELNRRGGRPCTGRLTWMSPDVGHAGPKG